MSMAPEIQNPSSMVSKSGRRLSPFPDKKITERTAKRRIREEDEWLIKEAAIEAEKDGNDFAARLFLNELPIPKNGLPQGSRDSAHEYLFGRLEIIFRR